MKCSHCKKPVVLIPSATERAKKYGGIPSDYVKLFPMHAACQVASRKQATSNLIMSMGL